MPILNSGIIGGGGNEEMGYFATKGPCEYGFHVPTKDDWQAVRDIRVALGGGSSDGTNFGIALKLPFAGFRSNSSAGVGSQGSFGGYRSSSRYDGSNAYNFYFYSSSFNPQHYSYRSYGDTVRPFKNVPVTPTSFWTKLYGTSIEAGGIFWSSTYGLISLSSDGQTWITIADKNLGATTVWNSGDTLSEANCGKYYQWGNNYGFPRTGSVTTSVTQVDAGAYGPGNYYSSSTFIKKSSSPYRWDITDNANLWGGTDGNVPFILGLKSYEEITAMTMNNAVAVLNIYPTEYYNKFNSEGHIYNYISGSIVYKCLSNDGTSIYYQPGTGKYAYYNESTGLWVTAGGGIY